MLFLMTLTYIAGQANGNNNYTQTHTPKDKHLDSNFFQKMGAKMLVFAVLQSSIFP